MKAMLLSGAAAVVLLAVPAAAQNNDAKTIEPHQLTVEAKKPPPGPASLSFRKR